MMDGSEPSGGWLEIWSCFPSIDCGQRWFVDHCTHNGKRTVADCATAVDADEAAGRMNLPILYIQE